MRSPYPSPEEYRIIYARYYHGRSVEELCGHLGNVSGLHCLDLCAGEGLATGYFLQKGASIVWSVDESAHMIREVIGSYRKAYVKCATVESALINALQDEEQFDRVVCRQGVNYWLNEVAVSLLAKCMRPGAIFVFNTLNTKPSVEPRSRTYVQDNRTYAEIAYSVGDVIHTVVACEGLEPHQSEILWLSRESLHSLLTTHFSVIEHIDGNSSVYVCTKLE